MKKLTPAALFCWYYLAVSPQGKYGFINANQLSKELGATVDELMACLKKEGIHPDEVLNTDFPMARHQVELQLLANTSSDGVLGELLSKAQRVYTAWSLQRGRRRDWVAEIAQEREQDSERNRERDRGRNRERAKAQKVGS